MELGEVRLLRGDDAGAEPALREALRVAEGLRSVYAVAECLEDFAAVALHRGQTERVAVLAGAAEALRKAEGLPPEPSRAWSRVAKTGAEALPGDARARGARMTMDEAIAFALES